MSDFLPTIILRHRKENLKKCSLRGLETRSDMRFFTYPTAILPPLDNYVLLHMDGPPLTAADADKGILLLDSTWHYLPRMEKWLPPVEKRSLPTHLTAYPRCNNPSGGLASIEALYLAYKITGRPLDGLLDNYYWKDDFLSKQ